MSEPVDILSLDETTELQEKFVVIDDGVSLKKVDLNKVAGRAETVANEATESVADGSGLTADTVGVGETQTYSYTTDEASNFLKAADFAAASLEANLKNADKLLDAMVKNIMDKISNPEFEIKEVNIDTTEIDGSGRYSGYKITGTDSTELKVINLDTLNYEFILINDSGEDVIIQTGGNIAKAYKLRDQDVLSCISINGVIYMQTSVKSITEFAASVTLEDDEIFEFPNVNTFTEVDISLMGVTTNSLISTRVLVRRTVGATVTLGASADIETSDTDDKFCIYEGMDTVIIKNRLGENVQCFIRISQM